MVSCFGLTAASIGVAVVVQLQKGNMGGRHKPGSRTGEWAKRKAKLRSDAFREEALLKQQLEAAILIAARLQNHLIVEKKQSRCWRNRYGRMAQAYLVTRQAQERASQTQAAANAAQLMVPTIGSEDVGVQSSPDARLNLLVEQVNAIKEENVALNRARFRCRKCG